MRSILRSLHPHRMALAHGRGHGGRDLAQQCVRNNDADGAYITAQNITGSFRQSNAYDCRHNTERGDKSEYFPLIELYRNNIHKKHDL